MSTGDDIRKAAGLPPLPKVPEYIRLMRDRLEPGIADMARPTFDEAANLSMAVSLKRIADAMAPTRISIAEAAEMTYAAMTEDRKAEARRVIRTLSSFEAAADVKFDAAADVILEAIWNVLSAPGRQP